MRTLWVFVCENPIQPRARLPTFVTGAFHLIVTLSGFLILGFAQVGQGSYGTVASAVGRDTGEAVADMWAYIKNPTTAPTTTTAFSTVATTGGAATGNFLYRGGAAIGTKVYMTPYNPTGLMKTAVFVSGRGNLGSLYK